MTRHTRRDMLRLACCSAAGASLVGGLSKFGLVSALAQGTTDYKALVCIFMFGGNDSNNMIVPIDSRYSQYLQTRSVLALPQSQLLPLQSGGQAIYGIRPEHFSIADDGAEAEVQVVEPTGSELQVTAKIGGDDVTAVFRERHRFNPGDKIRLKPDLPLVHLFDVTTGQRLT